MSAPIGRSKYWWRRATCREVGLDMFFPEDQEMDRAYVTNAKSVCDLCPVLVECLDDAYAQERELPRHRIYGVRGGLASYERHDLYRSIANV
jgi:hypothetical protein